MSPSPAISCRSACRRLPARRPAAPRHQGGGAAVPFRRFLV